MSFLDYPVPDLSVIPSGPDGRPNPVLYAAALERMNKIPPIRIRARLSELRAQDIRERDARVTALQQYEYKVLQRWLRRAAIIEQRHDRILRFVAILAGILAVGLPLAIVGVSFAWRAAVWAVAG